MSKSIVAALALGLLAFTLSILPISRAEATDCVERIGPECLKGEVVKGRESIGGAFHTTCCSTPSVPYATGVEVKEKSQAGNRPIKDIGRSKESIEALKAACQHQNWIWNEQTGHCKKPSQAKADCEAKGANYHYDLDSGGCVKNIARHHQGAPEQAEEQNEGDHDGHGHRHNHHQDDD
jgi:nitrite reductase/ring-hydroxylating ferredoxin subunit